jgi:hypothetical protein
MNFSTKAKAEIAEILAKEIGKHIEAEEISNAEELENGLREMLKEIGQETYRKVLENEDQKLGNRIECACGAKAKRISKRGAKVMTVFGYVSYWRSYYGCAQCGKKQHRVDERWGIRPGEVSSVLGKLLAIVGVDIAFERARRTIQEFLLVEVSDNTIRKQTQLRGEKQAKIEEKWICDSLNEKWLQKREREIRDEPKRRYGSMDGVQVPVGEEWRELKIISWYQVAEVYGQERHKAQEIHYHSEIASVQDFGPLVWATGLRHRVDKAKELIFVCDGAAWIWKLVERYYPDAIQIIDWYHACEYFTPIADAVFSQETERKNWLQKVKDYLWEGNVEKVIKACQTFTQHGLAAEAAQRAITYFTNNAHRMKYADYRAKGYWIGSGTVESACKQIAAARLKIAGARWTLSGANATAKARAAWLSDGEGFNSLCSLPLAA